MGNAQAYKDHCFIIGMDPDPERSSRSVKEGDFAIRALIIELRVGSKKLTLDSDNILQFKRLLEGGMVKRRREAARSLEELELLYELEKHEDLIDERIVEIEDLQYEIENLSSQVDEYISLNDDDD